MLNLHEEESLVLAGHVLIGREEVKPIIWTPGFVTTSKVVEVVVPLWHADSEEEGVILNPASREILGVWTCLDLTRACFPHHTCPTHLLIMLLPIVNLIVNPIVKHSNR